MDQEQAKKNGNGNGQTAAKTNGQPKGELSPDARKEIKEQQENAGKAGKATKGKKGKAPAFEAKPVPEAVKGIVGSIEKVTDLEHLKAVARSLKRHWKKVYADACKKATEGMKAGNVVWFKKGSKPVTGKVIKVKTNGKVKIEIEGGKLYRVAGTLVHKGKPTATDQASSKVTKKAA